MSIGEMVDSIVNTYAEPTKLEYEIQRWKITEYHPHWTASCSGIPHPRILYVYGKEVDDPIREGIRKVLGHHSYTIQPCGRIVDGRMVDIPESDSAKVLVDHGYKSLTHPDKRK
jgi:hypothetical protein